MSVPNVTIVSPFRDNADQVRLFANDTLDLDYPFTNLRIVAVEGDSQDGTLTKLKIWQQQDYRLTVIKQDTNEPRYPSVVSQERFAHLAKVFNKCLESVNWGWSDYSLIIPSDVSFQADLISKLVMAEVDLISPMFWIGDMANGDCRFYDIWGFINMDGQNFRGYSFAWYQQNLDAQPFEMSYIGGAMLCSRRAYEVGCRYTAEAADHGLCDTAKEKGFSLWCHPGAHIIHR